MQFKTLESCYAVQCSSGPSNFAICFMSFGTIEICYTARLQILHLLIACLCYATTVGGECVKQPGCRVCFCVLPCPLQPRAVQPNTAVFLPTWVYERYTNPSLRTSPFISMQFRTRCESKEFHCTPRCCSGYMMCEHMSTVSSVKKFLLCRKPEIEM